MPSSSAKQARFMRAVAHGWKPSGKKAPPVSVAKEFMRADAAKRGKSRPRKRTMAED
jgi:hypothetical protein